MTLDHPQQRDVLLTALNEAVMATANKCLATRETAQLVTAFVGVAEAVQAATIAEPPQETPSPKKKAK